MFIGHIGVGLAFKKADKDINVAWPIFFSLLPDLLLGIFVLLGIEKVIIPPDFNQKRYLEFVFPYSHSLTATIIWASLIFFGFFSLVKTGRRLKYALIFSCSFILHFVCDVIEHVRGLPVYFNSSYNIGFGLWNNIQLSLILELLLFGTGLYLYLSASKGKGRKEKYGLPLFLGVIAGAAVAGQIKSPTPPDQITVAFSWLIQNIVIVPIVYWLDR